MYSVKIYHFMTSLVAGIPGESLGGVVSARDLVSLYNGSPDSDLSLAASSLHTGANMM